jgi:hypothetical protein
MDQLGDIARIELPVGVQTHDEIGATLDPVCETGVESRPHAARGSMPDHRCAKPGRDLGCLIIAAVVDDEDLDGSNPW